jgi:alcohol dehydrogenase
VAPSSTQVAQTPGQTVAVVGMGGVGMAAMLTALAHDGVRVVAVDQVKDNLDRVLVRGLSGAGQLV